MAPDSSRQSQEEAGGVMPGDFLLRMSRSSFVKPNISEETPSAAANCWDRQCLELFTLLLE
jgi:hypothetical protein